MSEKKSSYFYEVWKYTFVEVIMHTIRLVFL